MGWTAPTLTDYQQSTFSDSSSSSEVTASISWNSGDWVVVLGITDDQSATLATPTATGLTFAPRAEINVGSACHMYAWAAEAGSTSSGAITSTVNAAARMRGLAAFSYGNCSGIGRIVRTLAKGSSSKINLTRIGTNSAVVFGLGDWSANADVTVTAVPSTGSTIRVNETRTGEATMFVVSWSDQGAQGTDSYGITAFNGVTDNTMIAVEILGTRTGDLLYRNIPSSQRWINYRA